MFASTEFLRAAAADSLLDVYREAAVELLQEEGLPVPDRVESPKKSWYTTLDGSPHLQEIFSDFRVLWSPKYKAKNVIHEYVLALQIHLPEDAPKPDRFDDIEPFFGRLEKWLLV